jgi:uncharacterized protein YkwD
LRALGGLCAPALLAGLILPVAAHADWPQVLSSARTAGCHTAHGGEQSLAALRPDARLDRIAAELGRGTSLASAITHGSYRATRSAEIAITGALDEAAVARVLVASYCAILTDPALRDVGFARSADRLWIVLAQPLVVPSERDSAAIDAHLLAAVNAARAAGRRCGGRYYGPSPPLTANALLAAAALDYSRTMARTGHFDHIGLDASTPRTRVQSTGYRIALVGENIAAGELNADDALRDWLASPGHCRNLMDPRFRDTGIGFAVNTAQHLAVYWTEDFATAAQSRAR